MIPGSVNEQLRQYRKRHYGGHVLALVDGIQYQQHTGQQLTPEDDMTVSLFAGTKDIALAHAGPWLVDPNKSRGHLADLGELEQARPGVIWLITSHGIEAQAEKLRPHLKVSLPDGSYALLRFWDPRIIHALNDAYQTPDDRELFRTAFEWQYLYEGQRRHVTDHETSN
ncbi:DUF4123 domain-containing protein [Paraburkholderia unamae]|uniref:Uncharacterized protein DUF4123 n=1 Tax=Paraburkholderia unamae TaxID=219649 RepID=A0ABX5KLC5_9BURK|nr:DUF4123 domain-containing protein [Paraburkholderia unamae]PVX81824.1 uncharacterized protein DUF4123 [Paraburkholderia unamae]